MKKFLTLAALTLALVTGTVAVMTVSPQQALACSDGW